MASLAFACAFCRRTFTASRLATTCSPRCRVALSRKRQRERREAAIGSLRAGLLGEPVALAEGLAGLLSDGHA